MEARREGPVEDEEFPMAVESTGAEGKQAVVWIAAMDPSDNETLYFFNEAEGGTTYDAPEGFYDSPQGDWIMYMDAEEDFAGFYVNRKTGESTWHVPWGNGTAPTEGRVDVDVGVESGRDGGGDVADSIELLPLAAETSAAVKPAPKPKPKPKPPPAPPRSPAPAWAKVRRGSTINLDALSKRAPSMRFPVCAACGGDVAATVAEITESLRKAEGRVRMLADALEALEGPLQHASLCLKAARRK